MPETKPDPRFHHLRDVARSNLGAAERLIPAPEQSVFSNLLNAAGSIRQGSVQALKNFSTAETE